jgi:phage shock protein C
METTKKLYRSRNDRFISGVCGGLGKYFNIDPMLIRIAFILLAFAQGFGILLYIILMVVVPLEPGTGEIEAVNKDKIKDLAETAGEKIQSVAHEFSHHFNTPDSGMVSEIKSEPQEIKSIPIAEIKTEPISGIKSVHMENNSKTVKNSSRKSLVGFIFVVFGTLLLLNIYIPIFRWINWQLFWPIIIIVIGFFIMMKNKD